MRHASDETSRPPRRRVLGRGPGETEAAGATAAETAGEGEDGRRASDRPGPEAHGDARPGTGGVPRPEADDAAGLDAAVDAYVVAVAEAEAGGDSESEAESETEAEPEARTDADAGARADARAAAVADTGARPRARSGAEDTGAGRGGDGPGGGDGGDGGGGGDGPGVGDGRFTVRLANFEGPFDLLLQLITKHKLDVTEVALSQVTDEFMAHLRALGPDGDLDQTTEFLVVAATLLDLKAARLLPAAEVEDEADLALLEARDLLFARLLQYRAYKRIAAIFEERWEAEGRRHPRTVGLEPHHAELLPEVVISIGAEGFARLAVKAMQPRAEPQVYVDHIHAPLVSVREQAGVVVALLRERGTALFRELIEDVGDDTLTVVARFLALLELYREKAVALDQETALGDLTVSWTGGETDPSGVVTDEFDQEATA
ncbi:segregation and condensation protein A [Streptomyces zaomyceticus]|uniref:segregation and condensation protein A n=1 Tax=Streptomyces zaomyceticus TaxID=68286 RepID=UPI00364E54BD